MKIQLLEDYRGVLTGEAYYRAGVYSIPPEMPQVHAESLVAAGRAVEEAEKPKPAARRRSPAKKPVASKGRTKKAK